VAAPPLHKDEVHTCLGNSILSANNRQMVSRLWEPLYVWVGKRQFLLSTTARVSSDEIDGPQSIAPPLVAQPFPSHLST